jgi:hypothetical protein
MNEQLLIHRVQESEIRIAEQRTRHAFMIKHSHRTYDERRGNRRKILYILGQMDIDSAIDVSRLTSYLIR